jgi:SNF2 family DNA or RNA helicase
MVKVSDFRWVAKPDGMEKAFEALQPAIRYATEDCIDLPPITHVMRETEMSSHQKKSYDLMVKKMRMEYDDNVNAANAAVKMGKLLQIACGTVKNDDGDYIHLDPTPRLKLLLEILEEVPEHQKVLVFCPYVATVELVSSYFRKKSISHARIVSGVSAGRRKKIFKDFQTAADPRVLVATPGTMSHGLNLEQASTVVWYSAIHDEDTYTQANGRVARPSQKNHMHIVHIEGSRVEREVYQSLRDKHSTSQALLNMYQELKS